MHVRRRALAALASSALLFTLLPATGAVAAEGTLSGVVTDPNGAPAAGICVNAHPETNLQSFTQATTNSSGAYTLNVEAGDYRIRFWDCTGSQATRLAQEWFDDAPAMEAATPVTVVAGQTRPADAQLAAGGVVQGAVVDENGAGLVGVCVTVADATSPSVRATAESGVNGAFTVGGLPTGEYVVSGTDCRDNPTQATSWYGPDGAIARGAADAAQVAVAAGEPTTIQGNLVLLKAGSISGTIALAGSLTPVANACVTAIDLDSNTTAGDLTDGAGKYTIAGLLPGRWLVRITDCQPGVPDPQKFATVYALPDGTTNPRADLAEQAPFLVGGADSAIGTRTVSPGGAISGRITEAANPTALRSGTAAGDPVANACVAAAPVGSLRVAASGTTGANGQYSIGGLSNLVSYRVFAYDCGAPNRFGLDWANDALIAGQATQVSVQPGGTTTNIDIAVGDVIRRAAGADRILTSVDLALGGFDSAPVVLIARADAYPDALAGAPLATAKGAPIMLTAPGELHSSVRAAIQSLGTREVILLGGTAALSPSVEAQAKALVGDANVRRVSGPDRFATARQIAREMPASDLAYVVEGANANPERGWPDAVSVAGLAAYQQAPLLLVTRDALPEATRTALLEKGIDQVTIVGGTAAVSDAVAAQIDSVVAAVDRASGADRYTTSAVVVERALEAGAWSRTLWLATGTKFPDALVAGAVVGQDGGILQLVYGPQLDAAPSTMASLIDRGNRTNRAILLGGSAAISELSQQQLEVVLGLR
jgi:putative cell wall-binding protein